VPETEERTTVHPGEPSSETLIHTASVFPGDKPIPPKFAESVLSLEELLGMPLWLLVQTGDGKFGNLDESVVNSFVQHRDELPRNQPVVILIDSRGGSARCAYQLGMFVRRYCGGFRAIVPRYAKSAATLLALGADDLILCRFGELGPLDVQIVDPEREEAMSALDEVHALERLHAAGIEAVDRAMFLMLGRSGKKVETLMPTVMHFVSEMMRPLMEKIDAVHYTQMSRALKVAEEYAIRLLRFKYDATEARRIARHLVENYPEHGFVIDRDEAESFGIQVLEPPADHANLLESLLPFLGRLTAIGRVQRLEE
jgi:hypothetical protein